MKIEYPSRGDVYKVKKSLSFTAGSNIYNIAGTHTIRAKKGDVIQYLGGSSSGETWWLVHNERVRFDGNGWCPALIESLKKMKTEIKYCEHCFWGVKKTKRGFAVYDSDKKFHHFVKKGSSDEKMFKKGLCPIHGTKLR